MTSASFGPRFARGLFLLPRVRLARRA